MRTQFKTQNLTVKKWAGAVMVSFLLVPLTHATLISVNFASDVGGAATTVGANTAGVVPVSNWNDIPTSGANLSLKDSTGATVNGLTFSSTAGSSGPIQTGSNFSNDAGDNAMMSSYPYSSGNAALDLIFSGKIPYDRYNVYVYYNVGTVHLIQNVSIVDGSGNSLGISTQVNQVNYTPTQFIPWTGANTDANYVEFAGLTSNSIPTNFRIRAQGTGGAFEYGVINGIQIEAIPEPSTILLLSLGGLLVWHRRRSRFA